MAGPFVYGIVYIYQAINGKCVHNECNGMSMYE